MKRKPIKVLSNKELEFIPKDYADMDKNAEAICDRPLVFVGKRLTREQRYEIQGKTHIKFNKSEDEIDLKNIKPGDMDVIGKGEVAKFIWEACVKKVLNVMIEVDGKLEEHDVYTDTKRLWETNGIDLEIAEAIAYFTEQSSLSETEVKN